jgi:hypothetical protein
LPAFTVFSLGYATNHIDRTSLWTGPSSRNLWSVRQSFVQMLCMMIQGWFRYLHWIMMEVGTIG